MPEAVAAPVAPAAPPVSVIGKTPPIPVFTEQTPDKETKEIAKEVPAESGAPAQNPPEQAPEVESATTDTTDEQPAKQGKNRYERRLDKAYRRAAEAQARAEFLEKQLSQLKPKEQPSSDAPRLEDFTDVNEWGKALAKHEKELAVKQFQEEQQAQNFKRAVESLSAAWESKLARVDKKYDDFDEVVGEIIPNNPVSIAIMQAENGEDIAYYLGTHLKEAQRIASLDPLSQAREIGRLETKLLAETPKAKTPSKAPPPITPVTGKSGAASDEPLDTDPIEVWMKKANAKSRKSMGL